MASSVSPKHLALDRAIARTVMDSAGGISYADIHDRSTETRKLFDAMDVEYAGLQEIQKRDAARAEDKRRAGRPSGGKDSGATIQTTRRKATLTGIK